MMGAAFSASARRLRELTPEPLQLVEHWPGRAPLAIICFDYARCDLAPYGEIAVCWPVVFSRRRPPPFAPLVLEARWPTMGWWVHHLPVTTQEACDAGRTLWGYPKFVADIEFEWSGARLTCTLTEGSEQVLSLTLDTRLPATPVQLGVTSYSALDGELLRTTIEVDAVGINKMRGDAELRLGQHRIGRELAELDLRLDRPIQTRWFPTWRAVLPAADWRHRYSSAPSGVASTDTEAA
jgi:hypothetical protein